VTPKSHLKRDEVSTSGLKLARPTRGTASKISSRPRSRKPPRRPSRASGAPGDSAPWRRQCALDRRGVDAGGRGIIKGVDPRKKGADSVDDGRTRAERCFSTAEFDHTQIYFAESKLRHRVAFSISRRPEMADLPNHLLCRRGGRYFAQVEPRAAATRFSGVSGAGSLRPRGAGRWIFCAVDRRDSASRARLC